MKSVIFLDRQHCQKWQLMKFKHFLYWFLRYVFLLLGQRASRFVLRWRLALGRKKSVFVIDSVFCQLGNNIQQIFVAIAHADRYSGSIPMSSEFYEHTTELGIIPEDLPRYVDQESLSNFSISIRANFFYYSNHALLGSARYSSWRQGFAPTHSSILGENQITKVTRSIAQRCRTTFIRLLQPSESVSLLFQEDVKTNLLVLRLRAGDVSNLLKSEYATNPLCYYQCLSQIFRSLVIVTQPGPDHILLPFISSLFENIKIIRGDYCSDFSLLSNIPILATSGVSTFPIAASLLSNRLEKLYASDIFLRKHLNPLYLRNQVALHLFKMPGIFRLWKASANREELLHQYRPPICGFSTL